MPLGVGWQDCQPFPLAHSTHVGHSSPSRTLPWRGSSPHASGLHLHCHLQRGLFFLTHMNFCVDFLTLREDEIVAVTQDFWVHALMHRLFGSFSHVVSRAHCLCFVGCGVQFRFVPLGIANPLDVFSSVHAGSFSSPSLGLCEFPVVTWSN